MSEVTLIISTDEAKEIKNALLTAKKVYTDFAGVETCDRNINRYKSLADRAQQSANRIDDQIRAEVKL